MRKRVWRRTSTGSLMREAWNEDKIRLKAQKHGWLVRKSKDRGCVVLTLSKPDTPIPVEIRLCDELRPWVNGERWFNSQRVLLQFIETDRL